MKNVVKLDDGPWVLGRAIGRFVEHDTHRRSRESLRNVTPTDVLRRRRPEIPAPRERLESKAKARGKRENLHAA